MTATRTLVRHDLRWALPLAVLGLLIHLGAQLGEGLRDAWVYPVSDWAIISINFYVYGASLVGLVAGLAEEVTRTREYLLHRPLSFARIFWTRHALGLAILTGWIVLTPSLHLLACRLFSAEASLMEAGRWWFLVAQGLPAFLFYALAVFAASAPRGFWGAALLTVAGATTVAGYMAIQLFLSNSATATAVIMGSALLAPVLLLAAYRCQRQGRDRDRPWDRQRLAIAGPVLVLLAMLIGAAALTMVHAAAVAGLYELYPQVAKHEGQYILRRWDPDERAYRQVDQQHRPGRVLPDSEVRSDWAPYSGPWDHLQRRYALSGEFPNSPKWTSARQFTINLGKGHRRAYLGSDGYVYLFQLAARDGEGADRPWIRKLGKSASHQPFHPETEIVSDQFDRMALFREPDGSLWYEDLLGEAPGFTRLQLPGDDRFVAADRYRLRAPLAARMYRSEALPLVVIGERGKYVLEDGKWTPLPAGQPEENEALPRLKPDIHQARAGVFHLTLQTRDGLEVLSHQYRPHTLAEKAVALFVEAPSLLRSPVTTVASALAGPGQAYQPGWQLLLLDPAIALGTRGTLAGNLILTMLLAGYTFLRLRRLGLPAGRRAFWVAAVLVGGFPAFVCGRLVETDRAWQGVEKAPEPKPAPARLLLTA